MATHQGFHHLKKTEATGYAKYQVVHLLRCVVFDHRDRRYGSKRLFLH